MSEEGGKSIKQRKQNPWVEHVSKVQSENPEMPYKDVLKLAKESYTPNTAVKKRSSKPKKEVNDGAGIINDVSIAIQNKVRKRYKKEYPNLRDLKKGEGPHVPNMNYAGPKTNLQDAEKYGPTNPLDSIARTHDFDYNEAQKEPDAKKRFELIQKADEKMLAELEKPQYKSLRKLQKERKGMYLAIKAKYIAEKKLGKLLYDVGYKPNDVVVKNESKTEEKPVEIVAKDEPIEVVATQNESKEDDIIDDRTPEEVAGSIPYNRKIEAMIKQKGGVVYGTLVKTKGDYQEIRDLLLKKMNNQIDPDLLEKYDKDTQFQNYIRSNPDAIDEIILRNKTNYVDSILRESDALEKKLEEKQAELNSLQNKNSVKFLNTKTEIDKLEKRLKVINAEKNKYVVDTYGIARKRLVNNDGTVIDFKNDHWKNLSNALENLVAKINKTGNPYLEKFIKEYEDAETEEQKKQAFDELLSKYRPNTRNILLDKLNEHDMTSLSLIKILSNDDIEPAYLDPDHKNARYFAESLIRKLNDRYTRPKKLNRLDDRMVEFLNTVREDMKYKKTVGKTIDLKDDDVKRILDMFNTAVAESSSNYNDIAKLMNAVEKLAIDLKNKKSLNAGKNSNVYNFTNTFEQIFEKDED